MKNYTPAVLVVMARELCKMDIIDSVLDEFKNNIIPKDSPAITSFLFEFLFEITNIIPIKDDANTINNNNPNVVEKSKFI